MSKNNYLEQDRDRPTRRFLAASVFPRSVSSDAQLPFYRVVPFKLIVPVEQAWPAIKKEVERLPRTQITDYSNDSLTAVCRSRVFRFKDQLDLVYRADDQSVGVRSAAKLGFYDFGVNRSRVERLRLALRARGVIE